MFTKLLLILSALLLLTSITQAQHTFTIQGQLKGVADGEIVGLYRNDGTVLTPSAMDTVRNGAFSFSDSVGQGASPYMLRGTSANFPYMWLEIWATPGAKISVNGKGYLIKTWAVSSRVPEQQEVKNLLQPNIRHWEQLQEISIAQRQLSQKKAKASAEERKKLAATNDSLQVIYDSLRGKIKEKELALLQGNPVTPIWLNKLREFALDIKYSPREPYRQEVLQLYKRISKKQLESRIGMEITTYLFPPAVVKNGEMAPDADLVDLQETKHRLAEYKGKYLLLDFWSVGCGPCLMAMPELRALSDTLKDKLTVVSLNIDDKKNLWKRTSEKENISWVNLNDDKGKTGLPARYGVNGIPHYVMISPEGIVLGHWIGYEKGKLSEKVREYLTKKESASAF